MKKLALFTAVLVGLTVPTLGQQNVVVENTDEGWKLLIDGEPEIINGMNWDYIPRGENFNYSLWEQPSSFIKKALDDEMALLQNMGVNAIRVYTGIPAKWITYIYENYGIYTMLNHSFGRYGLTIDGAWVANTEYSDPKVRELLLNEVKSLVREYKDTPGLLLYLLGNENNYGLFWGGAETEDIPFEDRKSTIRARHMYELFNEAIVEMKKIDSSNPVAFCNGDLLFLDIIAEEVPDADIFGTNVYRGMTFTDLYDRVEDEYGKPVLLTEFGSDAFNAQTMQEAQVDQAIYDLSNWKEVYNNAAGLGGADNSLGGFTFQFSDGWWKYGQTEELSVHNTNASWSNGGYTFDHVEGENNMNEEWFGIAAKGPTNSKGFYDLFPRAAYYALQEAHQFDPYAPNADTEALMEHFNSINVQGAKLQARGDKAALNSQSGDLIRINRFTYDTRTYNTGGSLITTPEEANPDEQVYPDEQGFDHLQSFYVGVEANPAPNVRGNVTLNVLGHVPQNPINEVFYENRGRPVELETPDGTVTDASVERVAIYSADYSWNHEYFQLDGFYRTGHYHWGYEGDFFGLYPEANYGPNLDIYNGAAPNGFEIAGKQMFDGLKVAFGPELWWGANPALLVKYTHMLGNTQLTGIYHEDVEEQANTVTSFAIPQPKTRRVTLHASHEFGNIGIEGGVIWGGQPLNGREFQLVREIDGQEQVFVDEIGPEDNWGGKVKISYTGGNFNWYAQSTVAGLVANGGADPTLTFTGWRLKDSGSGNQYNVLSGFTYQIGDFQIAPNFLWQQPIEGPIPSDLGAPARPRNILDDPFVVRANREQMAGEILLTYDPTPETYMYNWDNDMAEDAPFAANLGFVYRHLPTTQDAAIGILPDGRSTFAFPGAPPAEDLWEVHGRAVSKISRDLGLILNAYGGKAQANGSDARIINRYGADIRAIYNNMKFSTHAKVNDWGPYDYHRDFNLTFPLQLMADISMTLGSPDWFDLPGTRIGVRGIWRSLDQYSPRYSPTETLSPSGELVPDPTAPGFDNGTEWELRTYVQINFFN